MSSISIYHRVRLDLSWSNSLTVRSSSSSEKKAVACLCLMRATWSTMDSRNLDPAKFLISGQNNFSCSNNRSSICIPTQYHLAIIWCPSSSNYCLSLSICPMHHMVILSNSSSNNSLCTCNSHRRAPLEITRTT